MAELYFRQLRAGEDFGRQAPIAAQMMNFVYLIGDRESREVLLVDPAWAVADLVELAAADDMRITGALVTHYHPDHIGGDLFGHEIDGLAHLLELSPCPIHVHKLERHGVHVVTGISENDLTPHESGDKVRVGDIEVELLHTPGHTPGSLCFRVGDALVAGDTLFLQGCGRVDLPGGNADDLFHSITQKIGALPDQTVVYPGHAYSGEHAPLAHVRRDNAYLQVKDLMQWRRMLGVR
jgi:hydroxyacylglutathione hydrolase